MELRKTVMGIALVLTAFCAHAQTIIGADFPYDNARFYSDLLQSRQPSAIVQIDDTAKGILIPRLTEAQRDAINAPANALLIYNASSEKFEYYSTSDSLWLPVAKPQGIDDVLAFNNLLHDTRSIDANSYGLYIDNAEFVQVGNGYGDAALYLNSQGDFDIGDPAGDYSGVSIHGNQGDNAIYINAAETYISNDMFMPNVQTVDSPVYVAVFDGDMIKKAAIPTPNQQLAEGVDAAKIDTLHITRQVHLIENTNINAHGHQIRVDSVFFYQFFVEDINNEGYDAYGRMFGALDEGMGFEYRKTGMVSGQNLVVAVDNGVNIISNLPNRRLLLDIPVLFYPQDSVHIYGLTPATGTTLYCSDCTANDGSTGVKLCYNGALWKREW